MPRSTKQHAMETRDRILDAAQSVFHAQGVSRTSLDDVAKAASVTRGAIYWHFKNKSDLFNAMSQRVRLPMEAMVEASTSDSENEPLSQLRESLIFVLKEMVLNPRSRIVFDILFLKCEFVDRDDAISSRRQDECIKALNNFQTTMRNAIRRKQLPSNLDIKVASVAVHAMMVGLINNWLFMPDGLDLASEASRLVDACLDMVRYAPALRKNSR
jgi:TetR/AcrR family acrAB operon transcriptional repressor